MTVRATGSLASSVTETTPSGIEVLYQWEPKRLYKIRQSGGYDGVASRDEGEDGPQSVDPSSAPEWREVPSVTTVLGVLDKPALPWWGQRVGIEGVLALHQMGLVFQDYVERGGMPYPVLACVEDGQSIVAGEPQITELLKKHKLTVNHVRDKAGDRGAAVHDALEIWAKEGHLPDPAMFPATEQGYVAGLVEFLNDVPSAEPQASEVMVGSLEHGFAGRYDLRLKTTEEHLVVYKRTPVKGAHYAALAPGHLLTDLKTSSGVYPSHAKQLEGYEIASVEDGHEPTEARGILHVTPDGHYEFVRSWATADDFLTTLAEWKSQQEMKERKR